MPDLTRQTILEAARKRFIHFGPRKTTMAEIAADCGMSVGNLYRFFDNKEAIVKAVAQWTHENRFQAMVAAVDPAAPALAQNAAALTARMRLTHQITASAPRIMEMIQEVIQNHPEVLVTLEAKTIDLLAGILEEGMARGEIRRDDPRKLAAVIEHSSLRFNLPVFLAQLPLEQIQTELADHLELLALGLAPRSAV